MSYLRAVKRAISELEASMSRYKNKYSDTNPGPLRNTRLTKRRLSYETSRLSIIETTNKVSLGVFAIFVKELMKQADL